MGGGGSSNTVQKSDPWSGQQPYLSAGYQNAESLLNNNTPQYYGGSTVAGRDGWTSQGLDSLLNYQNGAAYQNASNTSQWYNQNGALNGTAQRSLTDTAAGNYLSPDSNPYLRQSVDQGIQAARAGTQSQFAANGRTGSGVEAAALSDSAGRIANNAYMQNYGVERQNQLAAAGQLNSQGLQNAQFMQNAGQQATQYALQPAQFQLQAGQANEGYNQSLLDADKAKFDFNQMAPWQAAQLYNSLINGNVGSTTSATTTGGSSAARNIGGALGGLGALGQGYSGLSSLGSGIGGAYNSLFGGSGGGAALGPQYGPLNGEAFGGY